MPDPTDLFPRNAAVESEARIRAILETAVDGIITIDDHGTIETFNPAAERLFGYRADEVVGRNIGLLMPEPFRSEHDEYIARYRRTGRARVIGVGREVLGLRKDGQTFPMDLSVSELKIQDRRLFTGIVRDLTERKQMERELLEISDREQRRIGQDLHDGLGQVLAGAGFMMTALQQRLAARSAPEAQDARQIADLLTQAISQARGMARGLHPVRPVESGLMSALEELCGHVQQVYRITCDFRCEEPVLLNDSAAATHVYRIAQEAINNAIKHGKAHRVTVSLTHKCEEGDGHCAALSIADDGVGFSELPQTSRKGLGLHIMRYRAAVVGAAVSIRRGAGGGTFVNCCFPLNHSSNLRGDHVATS